MFLFFSLVSNDQLRSQYFLIPALERRTTLSAMEIGATRRDIGPIFDREDVKLFFIILSRSQFWIVREHFCVDLEVCFESLSLLEAPSLAKSEPPGRCN